MTVSATDHWPRHARQWALVGPPLRPSPADVAIAEDAVEVACAGRAVAPRAVVLGVTPELVTMRWPAATRLLAVERSRDVIGAVYPAAAAAAAAAATRAAAVTAAAVRADWRALPCAPSSIDVVLGDGSASNLAFPADYRRLAVELRRVLAPGGRVVLRLFAAPATPESLAAVAAALRGGGIGSFHALKWRLAMAVQPADRNVPVAAIGRAFDAIAPDRDALAAARGWDRAVIDAIDVYRGSALAYSFPTLAEVRAALAPELVELACHTPGYELGDRCPTLVLGPG